MRAPVALALLSLVLAAAAAGAAERVPVRVGEHPGFSRLVFDWPRRVGVDLEQGDGRAVLRFERAGALDLARFRADPPPGVSGLAAEPGQGPLAVAVSVAPGSRFRLARSGASVVLDVLAPDTPQDARARTPEEWRRQQAGGPAQARAPEPAPDPAPVDAPRRKPSQSGAQAAERPAAPAPPIPRARDEGPDAAAGQASTAATAGRPIPLLRTARPAPEATPASPGTAPPGVAPPGPGAAAGAGQAPAPTTPVPAAAPEPAATATATKAPATKAPVTEVEAAPIEVDTKPAPPAGAAKVAPAPAARSAPAGPGPRVAAPTADAARDAPAAPSPAPARPAVPEAAAEAVPTGHAPADPSRLDVEPPAFTADPRPVMIDTAPAPARTLSYGAPVSLRFDWGEEVGAAAFRRDGALWLVFDRPPPGDLTAGIARSAPELAPVQQFELPDATAIRLAAPGVADPRLRREDSAWIVDLWARGPRRGPGIGLEVHAEGGTARADFRTRRPGRVVAFQDPDLGDRLLVVPVRAEDQWVPNGHVLPQFRALPSVQGLVLQPLAEGLRVAVSGDAVQVSHADGLIVSHGAALALLESNVPSAPTGPRLFDLERWRGGGDFQAAKQALQKALIEAGPERIGVARLALARFYFAHGLAVEALGLLRLRALDDPRLALDPEARLMAGVSAFLIEDYEAAAEELFHPALAGEWEADLWHAALAAAALDWEVAADGFAKTERLIAAYPRTVRHRLWLLAAEARLGIADARGAAPFLEALAGDAPTRAEQAHIAVLAGRRLQLEGEAEAAKEAWQRVVERSRNRPARVRARLALLDLALERGETTPEQAVADLERLRFAWRGDRFEFALLQRLGDLRVALGQYRDGLHALRQAASYFPNSGRSQAVAQRMREVFTGLYLDRDDDALPPLVALALFEEFKELTPPGDTGDAILGKLADRLIEVDLLGRAAELLSAQVKFRLHGASKARAGAKLARVRLMDGKPALALEAIELSAAPEADGDAELARRRRHLTARALSELGRHGEALAALGPDDDPAALRLRGDILWAQQNWPAAAVVLARLVPERPPADRTLDPDEARAAINLAVALTMAGEQDRLAELGRAYRAAFADGPQAEAFALLVGDERPGLVKSIAEQLAVTDEVEAFMAGYRKRLQSAGLDRGN